MGKKSEYDNQSLWKVIPPFFHFHLKYKTFHHFKDGEDWNAKSKSQGAAEVIEQRNQGVFLNTLGFMDWWIEVECDPYIMFFYFCAFWGSLRYF